MFIDLWRPDTNWHLLVPEPDSLQVSKPTRPLQSIHSNAGISRLGEVGFCRYLTLSSARLLRTSTRYLFLQSATTCLPVNVLTFGLFQEPATLNARVTTRMGRGTACWKCLERDSEVARSCAPRRQGPARH